MLSPLSPEARRGPRARGSPQHRTQVAPALGLRGVLVVPLLSTNLYVSSGLCTCVFLTSNKLTPTDLCLGVCLLRTHSCHGMQHRVASRRNGLLLILLSGSL